MALTLEQLVVELAAEAGNYAKQLDQVNTQTQSWASGLASSASALLGGVVVGAASAVVGGMVAIGGAAFDVSRETEVAAANMAAQLEIPAEKALEFAEIARDVYGNNFAGSVVEAGEVVAEAYRRMGDVGDEQLQRISEQALAISDNFDAGPNEALSAAETLMKNFGLTSDEAFDFIAKGFQRGLNRSDDFLDTIGEYSVQFSNADATADQFFSLLESGLQGGMLGTDKAADLFKEFTLRIMDGSKTTSSALDQLFPPGFAENLLSGLSDGSITVAQAFEDVIYGLDSTADPLLRSQLGVALLGTQYEDLGDSATLGLSLVGTSMADMEGAADQLNAKYNTFGDMFAGIWRKAVVSVSPATDKLLELANDAMPWVGAAFDKLAEWIPPAIDFAVDAVDKGVDFVSGLFEGPLGDGIDEGIGAFETVQDWIDTNMPLIQQTVGTVLGAITGFWDSNGDRIMSIVDGFLSIVQTLFDTYLNNALDIVKAIMQLINGDVEGAGETLKGIADRTMSAFLTIISTYIGMVQDAFGDVDWLALGSAIVEGIVQGLSAAGHLLWSALTGLVDGAIRGVEQKFGVHSPMDASDERIGTPLVQGIIQGITSNGQSVVSAAEAIVADTLAAMDFATNLDSQFGMFGDVFAGAQLEQYLAGLSERVSGNLSLLDGLALGGGGGFVDGGNNRSVPGANAITINIYTSDPATAGDSVVQTLRAYGLAA